MTDQVLAEFLSNGLLGASLVAVVWYFLREVKTYRAERDHAQTELRDLEKAMRETVVPAVVKMIDATQTSTLLITEIRAELREERNRRST